MVLWWRVGKLIRFCSQSASNFLRFLSQSVWTDRITYPQSVSLHNRHLFLMVLLSEKSKVKMPPWWISLTSLHMAEKEKTHSGLLKGHWSPYEDPTIVTSSKFTYVPKIPSLNTITLKLKARTFQRNQIGHGGGNNSIQTSFLRHRYT